MRKLLVPIDGSESSLRAVAWAANLAKRANDVSIHLLHVGEEPPTYEKPHAKIEAWLRQQSVEILARAEEPLRSANVPYTKDALTGPIAPTIAEHAAKLGCDAIVMGTRGMSATGNLVIGTVASKVVHLTRLPVTLVK